MADDGDLLLAFDGLFRQEVAALRGLHAEDVEQVGLGDDSADESGVIVAVAEADAGCALLEEGEVSEGGGVFAPEIGVAGIGSGVGEEFFEEADSFPDDDESAAVAVGEGLEEDTVYDAEEGGGGSDAEGEGEDGGEGEAGGLAELAKAVAYVLKERVHAVTLWCGTVFVLARLRPEEEEVAGSFLLGFRGVLASASRGGVRN